MQTELFAHSYGGNIRLGIVKILRGSDEANSIILKEWQEFKKTHDHDTYYRFVDHLIDNHPSMFSYGYTQNVIILPES